MLTAVNKNRNLAESCKIGASSTFEQLSLQPTVEMEELNVLSATASPHDLTASSSLDAHIFCDAHIPSPPQNLILPSSSNCHVSGQNTSCQSFMNSPAGSCLFLNQHPTTVQTITTDCDIKPQMMMTDSTDFSSHHNGLNILHSNLYENQNLKYSSSNSTPDSLKTSLHKLHVSPLLSAHTCNKNMISRQNLFPSSTPDVMPKLLSFCTDYEMSCNIPLDAPPANASTVPNSTQGLSMPHDVTLVQSMSSEHRMFSSTEKITGVQETALHHCLGRTAAPIPCRSQQSPFIISPKQAALQVDVMGNQELSSSSTFGEAYANDCPSPQVSDLGSEDTHISMSQHSFAQNYANLTPWTTKLTAPGYTPLPKPAPDAMPIPLEDVSNEYILSMSSFSRETYAQSHYARPYQVYRHLKPGMTFNSYNNTLSNSKTKSGLLGGPMQTQRPNFKCMSNKEHRFRRTADALQKSGLWEVAMKTGSLIKRNQELQKELEEFRSDAIAFLKSVIKNPENRDFMKNVLKTALTSNTSTCKGSSVMTVVVSAAAAASVSFDYESSSDGSMSGNSSA